MRPMNTARLHVTRMLTRFGRDQSGVATIFACFMIVLMVLVGGIAVDLMHNEMERTKIQATMDRAVLAAANLNQELDPEAVVRDYFDTVDLAEYLTGVTVDQGLNYRNVHATGHVQTPTRFMHHLGVDTLPAWTSATAEQAAPNIEISLVLDISGSMRDSERMDELRPAAAAFLNIVLHDDYIDDTSINLIPYAGQTNVGPFMFGRLGGARYADIPLATKDGGTAAGRYPNVSSCLELNASDFGYVGLPNAGSYAQVPHFMNWDIAANVMDWGWCPQDDTTIRYASNDRQGLINAVNNIRMHDGTGTHYAMKYALALLDPSSRPHFDAMYAAGLIPAEFAGRPAEYDDPAARKFIVLMTDGQITEQVRPKNAMHLKNPTRRVGQAHRRPDPDRQRQPERQPVLRTLQCRQGVDAQHRDLHHRLRGTEWRADGNAELRLLPVALLQRRRGRRPHGGVRLDRPPDPPAESPAMTRSILDHLRRFGRDEDGNMTIEFVLAVPLIFTIFLTSVEMGIYAQRQMWLDRGLDIAAREIRVGTGQDLTHDELRTTICENAGFLPDCEQTLRLELFPVSVRNFQGFDSTADCVDISEPITPLRRFVHGGEQQMMLIRACYMFNPVFASTGLGKQWVKDGSGRVQMVSYSGFVQEPAQ